MYLEYIPSDMMKQNDFLAKNNVSDTGIIYLGQNNI